MNDSHIGVTAADEGVQFILNTLANVNMLELFKAVWILIGSRCFHHPFRWKRIFWKRFQQNGFCYRCDVNSAILLYLGRFLELNLSLYSHRPWCEPALNLFTFTWQVMRSPHSSRTLNTQTSTVRLENWIRFCGHKRHVTDVEHVVRDVSACFSLRLVSFVIFSVAWVSRGSGL